MRELIYWNIRRPLQKFPYWFAARMPKWLVYHCSIRLIVHATTGKHENQIVPELLAMDALKRWERMG
mgnify:FL=1